MHVKLSTSRVTLVLGVLAVAGVVAFGVLADPPAAPPAPTTTATTKPKPKPDPYREKLKEEQPWAKMEYGSLISATINAKWPEQNFAYKGIAIRLGDAESPAGMCFDTD